MGPPLESSLQLGDFNRVDATDDPAGYVEWMRRQQRPRRDRELEALGVGPDDVVLDVGSGPGIELRALAEAARPAVGVRSFGNDDQHARRQVRIALCLVVRSDAQDLPFADAVRRAGLALR